MDAVELHAKNSNSVEYVRARVWVNADEPMQFRKIANFATGEVVPVELEYEKLLKVCFLCKRLTHDQLICPFMITEQAQRRGGKQLLKKNALSVQGKGKEIVGNEQRENLQSGIQQESTLKIQAEQRPKQRGAKGQLQGNQVGERRKGQLIQKEWRPKERVAENISTDDACKELRGNKASDETGNPVSKRRLSRGSEERKAKKSKVGSVEKTNQTQSVFERLGNSGDKKHQTSSVFERLGNSGERSNSEGKGKSKDSETIEKNKQSPSIFERLGSQSSYSGKKTKKSRIVLIILLQ